MKKRVSVKIFLAVMWRRICRMFGPIGKLLGVKDGSAYTRVMWRLSQGVIVTFVLVLCTTVLYLFGEDVVYDQLIRPCVSKRVFDRKQLSSRIEHQRYYYAKSGRIYDEVQKRVVIDKVDWAYKSANGDSLAVFAKEGKRGYLNRFTGEMVIPPVYTRAWTFSEGIAAVERNDELLFIDHTGQVVIDKNFKVTGSEPAYAFRNGYCIVPDRKSGMVGLIDRQGNWALLPEYGQIWNEHGMWKVMKGELFGLFSESMDTLYRADKECIRVSENVVEVHFKDHTAKQYDHEGNLLVDFVIDGIENMEYETTKLHGFEEAGGHSGIPVCGVADCQSYMVMGRKEKYYGLLDRNGKRITPPDYTSIEAIAKNLYLCQPQGVIINNRGERVE